MTEERGVAGGSARREYERRKAKDEARTREKWGRLGSIAVALSDERRSTQVWSTGAIGEERVGALLDRISSDDIRVLHDRRIPGTRANVDHLVITSSGVWVVDTKRYQGRPELRVDGGIVRRRVEKLFVGRRDQTKLVDGALWQVEWVQAIVGEVPVRGVLCFVEADWPLFGGSFTTRGVDVLSPKKLVSQLTGQQQGAFDVPTIAALLSSGFPAA